MRTSKSFVLLLIVPVFLTLAQAEQTAAGSANGSGDCAGLADLLTFISEETDYPPMQNCPEIVAVTPADIGTALRMQNTSGDSDALAVFLPDDFRILLGPDIDPATPLGRSYLLHELVHADQFLNNAQVDAPCRGWLEGEAYRIQAAYLKAHHLSKEAFDVELIGLLQSACADSYIP